MGVFDNSQLAQESFFWVKFDGKPIDETVPVGGEVEVVKGVTLLRLI